MKEILLLVLLVFVGLTGCRPKKLAPVEPPPYESAIIESEPERIPEEVGEPQIRTVEESFTFIRDQDRELHDQHQFFVIIGSFRVRNNAENFKRQMIAKGFTPVILLSETGLNRVSVNSYMLEAQARERIKQVRQNFPEHADTWLLIRG